MFDVAHLLICFLHANQAASVSWTRYSSLLGFAGSTHPSSSVMRRSRRGSCPKHAKRGSGRGQRHPNERNWLLVSSPAHVCLPCYEQSTRAKMAACEKMNYELGSNTRPQEHIRTRQRRQRTNVMRVLVGTILTCDCHYVQCRREYVSKYKAPSGLCKGCVGLYKG
jgi:hypothetical protein